MLTCDEIKNLHAGTGSIVSAVETASGRKAHVMGKPSTMPFEFISRHFKLDPKRTLMVGDRGTWTD